MTMMDKPLLEVINLRVHIQTRRSTVRALDGLSFALGKGRTLAIVGESGSGKSVLCRTIMGLLPDNAKIRQGSSLLFNGTQLVGLKESQYNQFRATRMAIIFQDQLASLHPVMTVGRQIAEPLRYHLKLTRRQATQRMIDLIAAVGLPDPGRCAGLYPHELSGGMRQRIAMAIALACNPQLLIADEPTTALDTTVQAGILGLLNHLQTVREMSTMIVTHDLGVAANVADRIAVMYAGKIVEIAPAAEIFKHPCHPYTRAMLEAVPSINEALPSSPASGDAHCGELHRMDSGCRFAVRCPQLKDGCRCQEPALDTCNRNDHRVACWHPVKGL